MIVGFKTGPRNWPAAQKLVLEEKPAMCELWFNVGAASDYEPMIAWLLERRVVIGLHHWGICAGNIKTNLATQDEAVWQETVRQIKTTIDIGQRIGCVYVNMHPGALYLESIDFATQQQRLLPDRATSPEVGWRRLQEAATQLHAYALQKGVVLTVETLPGAENQHYEARQQRYQPFNTPLPVMEQLVAAGSYLANDITHTIGSVTDRTETESTATPDSLFTQVMAFSRKTQPATRLLHVNTIMPPFDGTDSHDGLLDSDWQAGCFPSRAQLIEWLRLFAGRADVYAVPEPRVDMQANYQALRQLVAEVEKGG